MISPYTAQSQAVAAILWRTNIRRSAPGGGRPSYNGASTGWAQPDDSPAGGFAKRFVGWVGSGEMSGVVQGSPPARVTASRGGLMFDENSDIDDLVCRSGTRPVFDGHWGD
jgi:hypothetical protein